MTSPLLYETPLRQEGIPRAARYTWAMDPASVQIDDRKLEDYLLYVQQYAKQLRFFSTEEFPAQAISNWEAFYRNQPVFMLARIAAKDPAGIKQAYDTLSAAFETNLSINELAKLADFVFSRFEKIDRWYAWLSEKGIHDELALYIRSYLAIEFKKLYSILDHIHEQRKGKNAFEEKYRLQNKNNVWGLPQANSATDDVFTGNNQEEKYYNASLVIDQVFKSVFHTTTSIINYCREYFSSGIYKQQDHPPHVALLITFFKLFRYQQEQLNTLPQRMLDYYYHTVLHINPKKAVPDRAFILLETTKGFDEVKIDKGQLLTAGKDAADKPLFYKTDKEVMINKGQVQSVRSVQVVEKNDLVQGYYAASMEPGGATSWKIFDGKTELARAGFAIASTQFYLAKGERAVTVIFEMKKPVQNAVFDTSLFSIQLTGEEGWMDSKNATDFITISSLKRIADKTLELNFRIAITQACGVVAFNDKIHSGNFPTAYPVMQLLLQFPQPGDDAAAYNELIQQLNELLVLQLQNASIKVQVGNIGYGASFNGVTDLVIQNHESLLDIKKPFYPFTAVPKVGSSFYIGCSDLYYKPVDRFTINIEWLLPDNFGSYYEKYFPPYDNNKFKATLSMLKEKKWQAIGEVSLIDTARDDGKFLQLTVNADDLKITSDSPNTKVPKFDTDKKDNTVRLKLLYPDFGHDIYPQLITSSVLEKSRKSGSVDFFSIVKKQLYDSVISIKLQDDAGDSQGSFRIEVYNALSSALSEKDMRNVIRSGVERKLIEFNGTHVQSLLNQPAPRDITGDNVDINKVVVNDDRFFSRLVAYLRKIHVVDSNTYFDKDAQDVDDVAVHLKEKLNTSSTRLLPRQQAFAMLITGEVNAVIKEIADRIAEELLKLRKTAMPDGPTVAAVMRKYVDEANKVINDMIAGKIATLISATEIPPKPYTPVINTIAVSYISTKSLDEQDQFFHIYPFGIAEVNLFPEQETVNSERCVLSDRLFPLADENGGLHKSQQGRLFIGLSNVMAARSLTLFFQLAEGTRRNDKKPPALNWWYLSHNQWHALSEKEIIADSTYGLQTTGIVELQVPGHISGTNTLLPGGLYWLCVSAADNIDAFPEVVMVKAQAVPVTLENMDNDPSHFALPLPAYGIKGFVETPAGIKSVKQPVSSMQGKMPEDNEQYRVRVSERLRHKQRAITLWDYERLLLEEFPFIYKATCLNNYHKDRPMPGHVTVVPIINLKNKTTNDINLLPPRASYIDLRRMEDFLRSKSSPWVKLHAVNPDVNYVQVRCRIKLRISKDKGFSLQQLNNELVSFLTPWADTKGKAVEFSTKVYVSSVINFINSRDYIDYVTGIKMYQFARDDKGNLKPVKAPNGLIDLFETLNLPPHAILASAPVHKIDLI